MFRYKTNKQALIIAALVILLCLSCLTGATLALFTSDLNDGTIGIVTTSGDVEVDIVDTDGVTLKNKSLAFVTSSDNTDFLFEPGATFYTQGFQVKNTGDIPVNFRLSANEDLKVGGKHIDIKDFYEIFDMWITTDPTNPTDAKPIALFVNGLKVGESSKTYYLFIKMKESVGNDFQGKTYSGIGITVYAVQGNADIEE